MTLKRIDQRRTTLLGRRKCTVVGRVPNSPLLSSWGRKERVAFRIFSARIILRRQNREGSPLLFFSPGGWSMEAGPRPREILLVEDNPVDVLILQKYLQTLACPYHLSVVSDGEAGLAFLQRQGPYHEAPTPDLILLDIHLPKKTGWDILKWVKATPAVAPIPVVTLSTFLAPYDEQARDSLHPTRCVEKPTTVKKLQDLVKYFEALMSQHTCSDCSL